MGQVISSSNLNEDGWGGAGRSYGKSTRRIACYPA